MSRFKTRFSIGLAAVLVASLVLGGSAARAAAPAAGAAPTVDSIVADYIAARGGLAKIQSVKTLRQKGHAFAEGGREAVVQRELKRPGKIRFEFTVQGITGVYVVNGGKGWQVSPFDADMSVKPMADEAVTEALEQADIEGPLVNWKAKGHQVVLDGRETVNGREAYKLKMTTKSGATRYDYIDVKTHYDLRADSERLIRGKKVQLHTTFSDYKKTDGILFPGTVEVQAVGRPQSLRVTVDTVEVNPPIADARFERAPSSGKASPPSGK